MRCRVRSPLVGLVRTIALLGSLDKQTDRSVLIVRPGGSAVNPEPAGRRFAMDTPGASTRFGTFRAMCGRYVSVSSPTILAERFHVEEVRTGSTEANYNVAPRAEMPVVAESHGTRVLDVVRWGLVPSWAKSLSVGDRMINARADRLLTSNAYKRAFE